ncbi:MAG: carboxylesterase family protein [Oscillatoriales cyanobacterium C42_A2020_001]|nr:carboxylesterase family protein [Leptolyngbyaceae cyanobacterium C42_A2020_001]
MAQAGQPVWLYRYAYVFQGMRGRDMGTRHGCEIPFAFNVPDAIQPLAQGIPNFAVTPSDRQMADLTSGYWAQFGKTGNPNGGGRPMWEQHNPAVDRLMQFTNSGITAGTDPLKQRLDLWQQVWERSR